MKELQSLTLYRKIQITQTRIIEWYQHYNGQVCVSFSGGKDSTVLLHIARQIYPDIPAVFSNTGLEYPEIQSFVRKQENVDIVRPDMQFSEVVSTYGYPLISKDVADSISGARKIGTNAISQRQLLNETYPFSPTDERFINTNKSKFRRSVLTGDYLVKNKNGIIIKSAFNKEKYLPIARDIPVLISSICCSKMKKVPMHKYQKINNRKPIIATLAEESRQRKTGWIRHGCNAFEGNNPMSQPMSFWTEQDVLAYLVEYNVPIASVYGEIVSTDHDGNDYSPVDVNGNIMPNLRCTGCQRTGCIFCAFGFHLEKGETRFQRLARTHPRQYEYCIGGGQWVDNPHYDPAAPEYDGEWKNWNPKKIWVPSKEGLGMKKVFDMVNEIYGKDFYRYD